jgi:hypothetical protein
MCQNHFLIRFSSARCGFVLTHYPTGARLGNMEKLLTPLTIALILAVLGGHIYKYLFYGGKRRRVPGQHRYREADCVNTFWARVTPLEGDEYSVAMWGRKPLELGI